MKNKSILIFTFLISVMSTLAQEKTVFYYNTLKETIYVHYNSSLFFVGDNILYKTYNIRDRSKKLSELSKIAYVELVGADKEIVFKQTVKLIKGVGTGSFLIPNTVQTGHYKLIAYTQWMRNEGESSLFYGDIIIVNPKTINNNTSVLLKNPTTLKQKNALVVSHQKKQLISLVKNDFLTLKLATKTYKTRAKITLNIVNKNNQKLEGNYSVSVRKLEDFSQPIKRNPLNYLATKKDGLPLHQKIKATSLPEFKGDILKGKVISKKTGKPVANIRVALSIPNKKFKFRFSNTDKNGEFRFIFKKRNVDPIGIIQIVDENKEKYQLQINKKTPLKYRKLIIKKVFFLPETKQSLTYYSIHNQIETNYSFLTSKKFKDEDKLFGDTFERRTTAYLLDDYNRFLTLKETIIEIVKNVRVQKRRSSYTFHVKNSDDFDEVQELPLLLIDGVIIQNHNNVVDFEAKKIKSISVIRDKFYFEEFVFQGIIFVETFEKNYKKSTSKNYIKNINLTTPVVSNYVQKVYSDNVQDRIPDYRHQLYWNPSITLEKKLTKYSFFSSDITGEFEVVLEGFTKQGIPVLITKIFTVQEKTTQ